MTGSYRPVVRTEVLYIWVFNVCPLDNQSNEVNMQNSTREYYYSWLVLTWAEVSGGDCTL